MDVEPRSEEEQLAFFELCQARYLEAAARCGEVRHTFGILGTAIHLCFAGPRLVDQVAPALEHLRGGTPGAPELTLCLWDSESTGVAMPPAPCEKACFTDRGDIWGFASSRIRTAFHYFDFSVNLLDLQERRGVFWVEGTSSLPYWSRSSPLRTLLHWWLEHHGAQLVHGAAVATEEGAVLLTGKGGAGKSTTALACRRAGFGFLGDDYVVVRPGPEPTVHSLYATAKLDGASLDRFPELRGLVINPGHREDHKAVIRLHPDPEGRLRLEAPLRAVLLPRVRDGESTTVLPADPDEVLHAARFTTMAQLPYAGRWTHRALGSVCEAVPGYILELGSNLAAVPEKLRRLLSDPARTVGTRGVQLSVTREEPFVSVVIPVYNGEAFLREAVESVLAQDHPNLEILIVDDGSTDRTAEIIAGLPVDVRCFPQPNSGASAARNRGIRNATADLVAFLDVDDLWPQGSLRLLLRELAADPSLLLARGWAQVMELDPATGAYEYRGAPRESFPDYIGAALYRKEVFSRVGFFDATLRFAEDVDWFNRARELRVPMSRIDAVTLHVRRHGKNMTHGRSLAELNLLKAFKKHLDRRRGVTPGPRGGGGDDAARRGKAGGAPGDRAI